MSTDPKRLVLTAKQLDWVIDIIRAGEAIHWEYDNTVSKHWVASDILAIQIEKDMNTKEYEVHTW